MRGLDLRLSIRLQLLAMFGVLLVASMGVLVLDEISQNRTREALDHLKTQSLEGLRRSVAVSDAYGVDVIDTVFKLRNNLMSWEQAQSIVERATLRIELHWKDLLMLDRSPEQQQLFSEAAEARVDADRAVDRLRDILDAQDLPALGRFADVEMYPAIDPLATRLRHLADLELIRAEIMVRQDVARMQQASAMRFAISTLTLLLVGLVGRNIVRNIYRGVESLVRLANAMRRRQFDEEPRYQPRGELGEVVNAFVEMRDEVQKYEAELNASLEDIQRVQRALQERDLFQRSLLSAARIAILAFDGKARFTHVNPFAEELLGYRADELIGQFAAAAEGTPGAERLPNLIDQSEVDALAHELTVALDRPVQANWRALVAMAEAGWPPREFTMRRKDGTAVPVLVAVSIISDDQGRLIGLLSVATDLTVIKRLEVELRASEQQANEASRAKSAFLAAMSHEIRTPMIGVTGMVEVLSHTRMDVEQRRALNVIQHSAESLLQIIGDILDFSKIEAGRLDLSPTTVSLRKLVTGVSYNFMDAASGKGLMLTIEIDDGLGRAHVVDPVRLRQILANFVSNALKFTERGSIRIGVRALESNEEDERVEISVSDTGIGISEDAQKRLFQPFTQAEADTSRRYGGTGLGLTICRRLADLMGGSVSMTSTAGVGTTIKLVVLLARGKVEDIVGGEGFEPLSVPAFQPRQLPSNLEAERQRSLILLVDDHPTNRLVLARQLGLAGFACETAEDGETGLARWREGRFALVLTDVHMPKMDGYDLTRAIRAEEAASKASRTPIIAITAAAMKGESERCIEAGMDDFLTKPVTIPILLDRLQHWLPHLLNGVADPSPGVVEATSLPVLDPSVLAEISGGSAEVERDVLTDFVTTTRGDLLLLLKAQAAGDAARVGREAHKIKGAGRLVGALALSATAGVVETAARAGDIAGCAAGAQALDQAFAQLENLRQLRGAN
ncbi:MAG: ATP-binding protein [Pseudomarimonas sp.]